jgi:hypothetical protein
MFPLTTTLNRIKACNPCNDVWQKVLQAVGKTKSDEEPIGYETILDAVGIEKALWCCQAEPQHANLWRRYAVWCARQVQHLRVDERSIEALDVAERHANGDATDEELAAARAAVRSAWTPSPRVGSAARAAAWDPTTAWDAYNGPGAAARLSATAAEAVVTDVAGVFAAWDASWAAQSSAFRQLVTTGTLP